MSAWVVCGLSVSPISICFFADVIKEAKRQRKVLGGGWRQGGILAAAGRESSLRIGLKSPFVCGHMFEPRLKRRRVMYVLTVLYAQASMLWRTT